MYNQFFTPIRYVPEVPEVRKKLGVMDFTMAGLKNLLSCLFKKTRPM